MEDNAKDRVLEDFGHNVIPQYLENAENCFAYAFDGYWKDVGTIESLWEANMEMLDQDHPLNQTSNSWRVYTKNDVTPPQFITENASVSNSLIVDGCYIAGDIENSILSKEVRVGQGSKVSESIIMGETTIGENCVVEYAIIGEGAVVADGAVVQGTRDNIAVVGFNEIIGGPKNDGEE